jgi:hypothetical protein
MDSARLYIAHFRENARSMETSPMSVSAFDIASLSKVTVIADTGMGSSHGITLTEEARPIVIEVPEKGPVLRIETKSGEPAWLRPLVKDLVRLSRLPSNWNSYGAPSVNKASIEYAIEQVLPSIMRDDSILPSVVPTVHGGIQFEWHVRGIDFEVEIIRPSRVVVLFQDRQSGEDWEEEITDFSRLKHVMQRLSSR